jgi:hypothetical protein
MQRTEPEFKQAQAFEVGVAYPTPQKLGAARFPLSPRAIFMIILSWSDRSSRDDFHSGFDDPPTMYWASNHIVWGDEAKPSVFVTLADGFADVQFLELGTRNQLAVLIKQDLTHRTVQV